MTRRKNVSTRSVEPEMSALAGEKAENRRTTCKAIARNGHPCPSPGTMRDGYCYWHSPSVPDAQKAAARRRGHATIKQSKIPLKFTKANFADADAARAVLEEAADFVRAGRLPVSVANTLAKLASTAMKAAELRIAEQLREMEDRLREEKRGPRRRS